jgi:hypothetical protein
MERTNSQARAYIDAQSMISTMVTRFTGLARVCDCVTGNRLCAPSGAPRHECTFACGDRGRRDGAWPPGLTRQGSRKTRGSPGMHPRGPSCRASRRPACMPRCRSAPPARLVGTWRTRPGRRRARRPPGTCCHVPRQHPADWQRPQHSRRCTRCDWPCAKWLETGRSRIVTPFSWRGFRGTPWCPRVRAQSHTHARTTGCNRERPRPRSPLQRSNRSPRRRSAAHHRGSRRC